VSLLPLAEYVAETLDVGPGTRVFEVGCGDGAFLLPLHDNGYIVGGIDGDRDAIARASAAMPDGIFQVGVDAALDPSVPWDVVICRSFGARSDLTAIAAAEADQMRGLLARMFAKATHAIAVLDVPEERRKWMLHALAEIGANAIQMEQPKFTSQEYVFNVFARV
jgi:2-polyprenyl-3-methyl-5-hydroxy-6-metoxy-1,4-benzoquinol methylase